MSLRKSWDKQLEQLARQLKSKPPDGGIWTGPKVARWIEKENCLEKVWNQRGWDYLKKLRSSGQRPRAKHRKAQVSEQEEFKKKLPLNVKTLEEQYPSAEIDI